MNSQTATVPGSGSRVFQAQRDIIIGEHYAAVRMQFSATSLADVRPPAFCGPPIVGELVRDLRELRLLVLGGRKLREKSFFARHLAWRLSSELAPDGDEVAVEQWNSSTEAQLVEGALDEHDSPTVFIFPNLEPYHLGNDIGEA